MACGSERDHFLVRAMNVSGYRYEVDDYPNESSPHTVREAFQRQREMLLEKVKNIDLILASDRPEKAERMISDNPEFKIWNLVVPAPKESVLDVDAIVGDLLKKPETQENNKEA